MILTQMRPVHVLSVLLMTRQIKAIERKTVELTAQFETKIVGGWEANVGEYPWYVNTPPGGALCGGVLIHEDIVLSAAHCKGQFNQGLFIGSTERGSFAGGAEFRDVLREVAHEGYSDESLAFDLLALKLKTSSAKDPITRSTRIFTDTDVATFTVIGLGHTTYQGQCSDQLMETTIPFVPFSDCLRTFNFDSRLRSDAHLCAGGEGPDSCQGDSGGPMIDENGDLVGVVSFGAQCGTVGFPAIYVNVAMTRDWIDEQICNLSSRPPLSCFTQATPPPTPMPVRQTISPTSRPTSRPTPLPTPRPSLLPTPLSTQRPSPFPTQRPTPLPTPRPTLRPVTLSPVQTSDTPTPTSMDTSEPSDEPTRDPTVPPSFRPSTSVIGANEDSPQPSSTDILESTDGPTGMPIVVVSPGGNTENEESLSVVISSKIW